MYIRQTKRKLETRTKEHFRKIKMDLKEMGVSMMNWTEFVQNRNHWRVLFNMILNEVFISHRVQALITLKQ